MNKALLLLLLLYATEGQGLERFTGVSYLALQRFTPKQCTAALRVFRGVEVPALQFLWSSFGDDLRCVERFLELPQARKVLMIHATNETCFHKPRHCTRYDQPDFRRRAWEIGAFIEAWDGPGITFLVSTGLESDFDRTRMAKRAAILRAAMPNRNVLIVANPDENHSNYSGADVLELHGLKPTFPAGVACIATNDGNDVALGSKRDLCRSGAAISALHSSLERARKSDCSSFVWWGTQGECGRKWVEPRKRDIRLFNADIVAVNRILKGAQ